MLLGTLPVCLLTGEDLEECVYAKHEFCQFYARRWCALCNIDLIASHAVDRTPVSCPSAVSKIPRIPNPYCLNCVMQDMMCQLKWCACLKIASGDNLLIYPPLMLEHFKLSSSIYDDFCQPWMPGGEPCAEPKTIGFLSVVFLSSTSVILNHPVVGSIMVRQWSFTSCLPLPILCRPIRSIHIDILVCAISPSLALALETVLNAFIACF